MQGTISHIHLQAAFYDTSASACTAIAATPPTSYSLDAAVNPQLLYVGLIGGAGNMYV